MIAACGIAIATGLVTYLLLWIAGPARLASDFTYPWLAARAIARGLDPYAAVRAGPVPWFPVFFYPMPAALIAMPVAWLPVKLAGAVFVAVSSGLLAFLISRDGFWRLAIFLSGPAAQTCASAQWSPLMMAAALWIPALGLLIAKPTIALALLAYQSDRRAIVSVVIGASVLVGVSLMLQPEWPARWIETIRGPGSAGEYRSPIATPIGITIALAALRWRRPEARLLFVMACVPQKLFFYEQFPLLLIPSTRRELRVAVIASQSVLLLASRFPWITGDAAAVTARCLPYVVIGLYWPALVMVLRRPNEGPVPGWIERAIRPLPSWMRGAYAG